MKQNTENQRNTLMDNRLFRLQEVAHYLNISRSYAYVLVQKGQLPCMRFGSAPYKKVSISGYPNICRDNKCSAFIPPILNLIRKIK